MLQQRRRQQQDRRSPVVLGERIIPTFDKDGRIIIPTTTFEDDDDDIVVSRNLFDSFLPSSIEQRGVECDLLLRAVEENNCKKVRDAILYYNAPSSYAHPNTGRTALHIAVDYGHIDCIHTLLEDDFVNDIDVNATDTIYGYTPLHTTLRSTKTNIVTKERIVRILLTVNADVTIQDYTNKYPIDYIPKNEEDDDDNKFLLLSLQEKLQLPPTLLQEEEEEERKSTIITKNRNDSKDNNIQKTKNILGEQQQQKQKNDSSSLLKSNTTTKIQLRDAAKEILMNDVIGTLGPMCPPAFFFQPWPTPPQPKK